MPMSTDYNYNEKASSSSPQKPKRTYDPRPTSQVVLGEKQGLDDEEGYGQYSIASAGAYSEYTADEVDLEKAVLAQQMHRSERSSRHSSQRQTAHQLDHSRHSSQQQQQQQHSPTQSSPRFTSAVRHYTPDDEESFDEDPRLEAKAWQLLIFFSAPVAILSFITLLWAIAVSLITLLVAPVHLCSKTSQPFSQSLRSRLATPLNIHLRCIYSAGIDPAALSLPKTLFVHFSAPFLSLGFAIWSIIVAIYWLCSAIVGNPDGLDGRNDGRELVLSTRQWWEDWLLVAAKSE